MSNENVFLTLKILINLSPFTGSMQAYYALFVWLSAELFLRILSVKTNWEVIGEGKPTACVWNQFPNLWLAKPHPDVIVRLWILDVLFAGSGEANMHPLCRRSAKGKNNCVLTLNAKVKTEVGASFGKIHQGLSVTAGGKRLGNLRNIPAQNRAITHKNSRKWDKYCSVVIFLSPLLSVLSP